MFLRVTLVEKCDYKCTMKKSWKSESKSLKKNKTKIWGKKLRSPFI